MPSTGRRSWIPLLARALMTSPSMKSSSRRTRSSSTPSPSRSPSRSRTPTPSGSRPKSSRRSSGRRTFEAEVSVSDVRAALDAALEGGPERHRRKVAEQQKLPVRERVARLLDPDSLAEEGLLANWEQEGLGADGVVTGIGRVGGRPVALMANDPAVKAGSW